MPFKKGDRVVFKFSTSSYHNIPVGTIGTVSTMLDENTVVVRYGYNKEEDREIITGVPSSFLRLAIESDLDGLDYEELVPSQYRIGGKIQVLPGVLINDDVSRTDGIGIIKQYIFALNENEDKILVEFFDKNKNSVYADFEISFAETYCRIYDEEFENQLGEEIDLKNVEKNYHLIAARMFFKTETADNVVILKEKHNGDIFEVIDLKGQVQLAKKESLFPIKDMEMFNAIGKEFFVHPGFEVSNKFQATDEISKHHILRMTFRPGDVVTITDIDSISINSDNDTVYVEDSNKTKTLVSIYELKHYFKEFKGMIKHSKGEIKETYDDINSLEDASSDENYDDDFLSLSKQIIPEADIDPPFFDHGKYQEITQDMLQNPFDEKFSIDSNDIVINEVTINGIRFGEIRDGYFSILTVTNDLKVDDIDKYIDSLKALKGLLKRG